MNTNYQMNYLASRYPWLYQRYMPKYAAQGPDPAAMGGAPPMDPSMMGGMPPMDPSMMGGAPPMDPSMMGGAPPMDPSMMGGMPPMPPMDPSMLAGMMPPAAPPADPTQTPEAKVSNKVKTEQWMSHIDSYCYNMLNLIIELFNQLNLKVPSEALLPKPLDQEGPSAEELSKMMADSVAPAPTDAAAAGGAPPMDPSMMGGAPPMEAPKTAGFVPEDFPVEYADLLTMLNKY